MVRHAFKVLCPEPLVSTVLGSRGRTKESIQDACACKIAVSNRDEFYPGTRLRVLTVQADEPDSISGALDKLLELLEEAAERERSTPSGLTAVEGEPDFYAKDSRDLILRCTVPVRVGSAIIGPRGSNVQALEKDCGVRVHFEKDQPQGHQLCRLAGRSDCLRKAVHRVHNRVADEAVARPQEFSDWASVRAFDAGGYAEGSHDRSWERDRREKDRSRSPRRKRSRSPAQQRLTGGDRSGDRGPQRGPHGLEALAQVMSNFPEGSSVLEYEVTCELPPQKVRALIGPRGDNVKNTRRATDTDIHFDEVAPGANEQTMRIRGGILNVYRAHVQMMKMYHDDEAKSSGREETRSSAREAPAASERKGSSSKGAGRESGRELPAASERKGSGSKGGSKGSGRESGKGASREGGKGKDSKSGKRRESGRDSSDKGNGERRENLEGMLANLQRQLEEVKGKLDRS